MALTAPGKAKTPRRSRAERSETTRRDLLRAAAEVVGEMGYAEASVARITARAGIAQGTFYNYFSSRQDLFDQLLPGMGSNMLEHIRNEISPETTGPERERKRLRAYFDFLEANPEFYRILYEAETLAPAAHAQHIRIVTDGYVRALTRSWEKGEMPGFERHELEVVATILLAARFYLSMRYGREAADGIPDWVVQTYVKMVSNGLFTAPERADEPA